MPKIEEAIEALLDYKQADMEGVMVLTSRQAIHEVTDELSRMLNVAQDAPETERIAFEAVWAKRQWLTAEETDKDLAWRWWQARAAQPPDAPVETGVTYEAIDAALAMGRPGIERMVSAIAKETGERIEQSRSSAGTGGQWQLQHSVPSDGFECFYILKNGLQIAEVSGPQNVENTANLQELISAANAGRTVSEPQEAQEPVWWRWRFFSERHGWSKWIALNNDEIPAFKELQGEGIDAGRVELEPLFSSTLTRPESK